MINCLFLPLFFLVWGFFLNLFTAALTRMGETRAMMHLRRHSRLFYYSPIHRFLYKNREYELLYFSGKIGASTALIGFGLSFFYCLFSFPYSPGTWLIFIIIALLIALFLLDYATRAFAIHYPQKAALFSYFIAAFFLYLTLPFSLLFGKLLQLTTGTGPIDEEQDPIHLFKEKIMDILQSSAIRSKWDVADQKLIESVVEFKDRIVREVMVPRVNLFCLPVNTTIREAAEHLVQEGYSRTPIYKDTIDNIIGVLMYKDVLQLYMECEKGIKDPQTLNSSIETMVKDVLYTPETKKVSHLLQEFRNKQTHIAIVVDEYGGTEGIVTIEDILEEIVGDIADEYDIGEENLYVPIPGGKGWIVDARMSILDAEESFDINIPQEGDYDTLGGYVYHRVGSIPAKGLLIHHDDFDLEILSSTERSVKKIKITPRSKEND